MEQRGTATGAIQSPQNAGDRKDREARQRDKRPPPLRTRPSAAAEIRSDAAIACTRFRIFVYF